MEVKIMCKTCGTEWEKNGYCVECGNEICINCASQNNPKVHAKCLRGKPIPISYPCAPPYPSPESESEPKAMPWVGVDNDRKF